MNTDHHSLALFLHPMCRKLAISQAANGRHFEFMVTTALSIAKQWQWGEEDAKALINNLKEYQRCTGVFAGGQADALDWWECLPVTAKQCPLKTMAVILHSVVPHAADVERYFSALGSTQSAKRCNLTVETFEALSKLRSNYSQHLYKMDRMAGKSTHRKHAHMHTQPQRGIDTGLVNNLVKTFTWSPPLGVDSDGDDDLLAGPESITDAELIEAFETVNHATVDLDVDSESGQMIDPDLVIDGNEVLEGLVYDFKELEAVTKGSVPIGFVEDISILDRASGGNWKVEDMLASEGLASST
ncbi:hypothetical protein EV363DRAFT_1557947 [Boletus edulis]|nr:hypothetical protein EV363DRAFT_1557947 [Boletus edulis]